MDPNDRQADSSEYLIDKVFEEILNNYNRQEAANSAENAKPDLKQAWRDGQAKSRARLQSMPTEQLVSQTVNVAWHLANGSYTLATRTSPIYADKQPISPARALLMSVNLAASVAGARRYREELARRAQGGSVRPGSQVSLQEPVEKYGEIVQIMLSGVNCAQAIAGQTLKNKRQLSRYGRLYLFTTNAITAANLTRKLAQ